MKILLSKILMPFVIISCTSDQQFSKVKKLEAFPNTAFIPTLEHTLSQDKNMAYAATFLLAWDEVRHQLSQPVSIPDEYADLRFIHQSTSFQNVLLPKEFTKSCSVSDGNILIESEFSKTLLFEPKLKNYGYKLNFKGQKVAAFGIKGQDKPALKKLLEIWNYTDENNFLIKLTPQDKDHEVILFKTEKPFSSFAAMLEEIQELSAKRDYEESNIITKWEFSFNEDDRLMIPELDFNIEANYTTLEGNQLKTETQTFTIARAWQRNAFQLNAKGAVVESKAEIEMSIAAPNDMNQPKQMIFDKPFYIVLTRKDAAFPYFAVWVANTEFMKTQ